MPNAHLVLHLVGDFLQEVGDHMSEVVWVFGKPAIPFRQGVSLILLSDGVIRRYIAQALSQWHLFLFFVFIMLYIIVLKVAFRGAEIGSDSYFGGGEVGPVQTFLYVVGSRRVCKLHIHFDRLSVLIGADFDLYYPLLTFSGSPNLPTVSEINSEVIFVDGLSETKWSSSQHDPSLPSFA